MAIYPNLLVDLGPSTLNQNQQDNNEGNAGNGAN
jgi:hypothetical protein